MYQVEWKNDYLYFLSSPPYRPSSPPTPPPPWLFPLSLAKWVKRTEVLQQLAAFVWHYSLFRWNTEELWWILKWDSQNFPFEEKVFAQHGGSLCFLRFNLEESWFCSAWQYPYTLLFPLGLYSGSCLHSISSQLSNAKRAPSVCCSVWNKL